MRRYDDNDEVDICIVGAGAGGSVLAQRLARAGWRVVIIEAGPFWHPDEDWVSDEAGSHRAVLDPEADHRRRRPHRDGQEQLRARGGRVDGPLRRVLPPLPPLRLPDPDASTGSGADWPIAYEDIRPHYETVERELPVAGQDWPWGHPHTYPFSPHPVSEAASVLWRGRHRLGHHDARRARSASSTAPSATARTASTGASACRAARSTPRPAPTSPTCPTPWPTAWRSGPTAWRPGSRSTRPAGGPPA